MADKKRHNPLISRKKLEYIAHNFNVSQHAKKRLQQRCKSYDVRQLILNSPLWWRNTDGTICVATDLNHYLVIAECDSGFNIITYENKSLNGYNVVDKFIFACLGIDRKQAKKENEL